MQTDIVLGGVMLAMAVLGGIVSAHAPQKVGHKWCYILGFLALGIIGFYFVVRQSNETEVANTNVTNALNNLESSSEENKRISDLNTHLQRQLLDSTKLISGLARRAVNETTGGNSYPIILPFSDNSSEPFHIVVSAIGAFNLVDISVNIMAHMSANDPEGMIDALKEVTTFSMPLVPANRAVATKVTINPKHDPEDYQITTTARNGTFVEYLGLVKTSSTWTVKYYEIFDSAGHLRKRYNAKKVAASP